MTQLERTSCADITGPQADHEESLNLRVSDCRMVMNHVDEQRKGPDAISSGVTLTQTETLCVATPVACNVIPGKSYLAALVGERALPIRPRLLRSLARDFTCAMGSPVGVVASDPKHHSYWGVPVRSVRVARPAAKPTRSSWTVASGRRWVAWCAAQKMRVCPEGYRVIGNAAAERLFRYPAGFVPHPLVLENTLRDAEVWCVPRRDARGARVEWRLLDGLPYWTALGRYLVLRDRVLRSERDLAAVEHWFWRDRPCYRAAKAYLAGDDTVDYGRLRRSLDTVARRTDSRPRRPPPRTHTRVRGRTERLQGLEQDAREAVAAIASAVPGVDFTSCARVGAFLTALSQQSTTLGVAAVVAQFALHFPESIQSQWRLFALGMTMVEPQGALGISYFAKDFLAEIVDQTKSRVWEFVAASLMVLLGQQLLPATWANLTGFSVQTFAIEVRKQCSKQAVKTIAESLVLSLGRAATLLRACIRERSLQPLLTGYSPVQWCTDVHALVTYYPELVQHEGVASDATFRARLAKGLLPSGIWEQLTPDGMRNFVDELFAVGQRLQLNYRGSPFAVEIESCMREVRRLQAANSTSHSVMAQRIQPFGVFLCGPPGSGKTNLSNEIYRAIARRMGYPTDDQSVYSWQMNVNFQDGLDHTHVCIRFDDVDQNVAPPVATTDNHYTAVLKVVNNAPLPVEQSDVAMKGKISAKPLIALYCSNFYAGRLKGYSLEHGAFWRRLPHYLVVRAREGFEKEPGTGILDGELVRTHPDANYLSINLYRFDPASKANPPMSLVASGLSKQEVILYLGGAFEEHLTRQREFLFRGQVVTYCPRCFSDSEGGDCLCGYRLQAGWDEAGALVVTAALTYAVANGAVSWVRGKAESLVEIGQRTAVAAERLADSAAEVSDRVREVVYGWEASRDRILRRWRATMRYAVPALALATVTAAVLAVGAYLRRDDLRLQERTDNKPVGLPPSFVRAPMEFTPGLERFVPVTYTLDELVRQAQAAYVVVRGERPGGVTTVWGVCVGHNTVLTVAHAIPENGGRVQVEQTGIKHDIVVSDLSVYRFQADLALLKVHGLAGAPSVFKKIWYLPETRLSSFDEVALVYPHHVAKSDHARLVRMGGGPPRVESDLVTLVGDCGLLYAGHTGAGWRIVAMHHAAHGNGERQRALGELVTQHDLEAAFLALSATPHGVEVPRLQCSVVPNQKFDLYPVKSEFWSAVSHFGVQAKPLGTANPNVHGSTMRSRVEPTLIAEDFRDVEEAWCGESPYWKAPDFAGRMVEVLTPDGPEMKWVSPYTLSLIPLRRGVRLEEYYWLALADYLYGLRELEQSGYRAISLHEAVTGLSGTVIQPVDLTTSVGMPFNRPKKEFLRVHEGGVFVDPRILASFREMWDILEGGDLPAPVAIGMLKDEQVKPGKPPRVFNCLPFAYNWLLRCSFAGLVAFERANSSALECFVGVNMTSSECNDVVRHLASRDPTLKRLLDMDVSKQDKSEDGVVLDFAALADAAKANHIGQDPVRIYALNHADRNCVSVFKNDFFIMGAQNPSGGGRTVERNSTVNSLQQRYMYFRMKYPELPPDVGEAVRGYARDFMCHWGASEKLREPCTFRAHCALATYGDDALIAVSTACSFYDPARIPELGLEMGMVFTDARKGSTFEWQTIAEVQFLRRSFVWDAECERYLALLSRKSLAKMLVLAKRSQLTRHDHAAVLMSNVLRELAYYGESEYEQFRTRFEQMAVKHGLEESPLLRLPPFSEYRAEILAGTFSAWADFRE